MEAIPRRAFFLTSTLQDTQNEKGFFLKDKYALIAPALVPGFALENKIWALFQVSEIGEVDWSQGAYNDLQIDFRTKTILLNLVRSHQLARVSDTNDVIPGKGNGLVFLLHGAPGTGKTFTARMLAQTSSSSLPHSVMSIKMIGLADKTKRRGNSTLHTTAAIRNHQWRTSQE